MLEMLEVINILGMWKTLETLNMIIMLGTLAIMNMLMKMLPNIEDVDGNFENVNGVEIM